MRLTLRRPSTAFALAIATTLTVSTPMAGRAVSAGPAISFGAQTVYSLDHFPAAVAAGDVDADGHTDLVVAETENPYFLSSPGYGQLLRGDGRGGFVKQSPPSGWNLFSAGVAMADVNGDGAADAAITHWNDYVEVFGGGTTGWPARDDTYSTGSNPMAVALADVDRDGAADLVVANSGWWQTASTVSVRLGDGRGGFAAGQQLYDLYATGGYRPRSVAVGDLNGDGWADVATANWDSQNVSVLYNRGDGTFGTTITRSAPASAYSGAIAITDLDGDGRADLVVSGGSYPGRVTTFLQQPGGDLGPARATLIGADGWSEAGGLAVADLDRDGDPDVAVVDRFHSTVEILANDGHGLFSPAASLRVLSNPTSIAAADFDADGRIDLAAVSTYAGGIGVLMNTTPIPPPNAAPAIDAGPAQTVDEGQRLVGNGSFSDPDSTSWTATVDYGDGTGVQPLSLTGTTFALDHTYAEGPGSHTVTVRVTDDAGATGSATLAVTVANAAPMITAMTGPTAPLAVATSFSVSVSFTDAGRLDAHAVSIDWGDGVTSAAVVTESGGAGSASAQHRYTSAGFYTVTVAVVDDDGGSTIATYGELVCYDPSGPGVRGNGTIPSSAGSYTADPAAAGTARFGLSASYKSGATVPSGRTRFVFRDAAFEFTSASYDWLVVVGARAQLQGRGEVGRTAGYAFLLTTVDGVIAGDGVDRLRLKVWKETTRAVVYDGEPGSPERAAPTTAIATGRIVIR